MDFFKVLGERHSTRSYKTDDVEEDKIQRILESVNDAPSAGNQQAYEIVLVQDSKTKAELSKAAYGQAFIEDAPLNLVFFANPERAGTRYGQRGRRLYCIQDATIAAAFAELSATALGLASCWVGAFDDNAVSQAVNAPLNLIPVGILPIGYADEKSHETSRRALDDLVKQESF